MNVYYEPLKATEGTRVRQTPARLTPHCAFTLLDNKLDYEIRSAMNSLLSATEQWQPAT